VGPNLIRAVTHLDVNGDDVKRAGEILRDTVRAASNGSVRASEAAVVY
jgi:hypothetical protein